METLWPALLLLGSALWWWHASLQALDLARDRARQFCRQQKWQLLDQTVALSGVRLARDPRGLCLRRRWRFEFSSDGSDRCPGGLVTTGRRVVQVWADGPEHRVIETPLPSADSGD